MRVRDVNLNAFKLGAISLLNVFKYRIGEPMTRLERLYWLNSWAGFASTLALLSISTQGDNMAAVTEQFGVLLLYMGVPYLFAALFVRRAVMRRILAVRSRWRAMVAGIIGSLCTVILVSVLGAMIIGVSQFFGPSELGVNLWGAVYFGILIVVAALAWAGLPALVFGSLLGSTVYSANREKQDEPDVLRSDTALRAQLRE